MASESPPRMEFVVLEETCADSALVLTVLTLVSLTEVSALVLLLVFNSGGRVVLDVLGDLLEVLLCVPLMELHSDVEVSPDVVSV